MSFATQDVRAIFLVVMTVGIVGAIGCSVTSANPNPVSGGDAGPSSSTADAASETGDAGSSTQLPAATGPATCVDILTCSAACAETDEACRQACLDRGSDASRTTVAALAQCYADNDCKDDACITSKCETELDGCLRQSASGGSGSGSPSTTVPTGEPLPETLVGRWQSVGLTTGQEFDFTAEGATIVLFTSEVNYGCTSKITAASDGVSVVKGDKLVFHREAGKQTITPCGGATKATALTSADFTYTWKLGTDEGETALSLTLDGSTTILRKKL